MPQPLHPSDAHLTRDDARAFLAHTEQIEERRPLLHLLAACAGCRAGTGALVRVLEERRVPLDASVMEIEAAVSEIEAGEAWEAVERTHRLPERPTWGLAVRLAETALERARHRPEEARALAELAVEAADSLLPAEDDPVAPTGEWLAELRALARAALGESHRRAGDPAAAERHLQAALVHLDAYVEPADELPFRTEVLAAAARLRAAQGRRGEAADLLRRAVEAEAVVAYRPDRSRRPSLLLELAAVQAAAHDLPAALDTLRRALA